MDFDLSLPSGRIRARRWGPNGAPLLLCIHGLSANHLAFAYLAECIAGDNRQVVSIDLRGRGRSTVSPPGSYGLSSHARDVIDVADALGAADFDIVGWSLGAMIAMKVAQREGARLRSVALIDHAGPSEPADLAPIHAGLARLDAVVQSPEVYLATIQATGIIEPWSSYWDDFYSYELGRLPCGLWSPTTSRAAAEEDIYRQWPNDWREHWRALTMPTVLIRALRPLQGSLFVPDRVVAALHTTNPRVSVVDAPANP